MNLIDLDFDADRNSGSSRASLYDVTNKDYFRGHSYSPESEALPPLPQRMLDMGRIIAKSSSAVDPMPGLTHVQSNDSIASRSTPDISIPPFGQSMSNGLPALSPNAVDMSGHSSALGGGSSQQLDLNDYITQLNLAQLMYMNTTDPSATSVSSSANTPSPTPITPSVPLENGALVLN